MRTLIVPCSLLLAATLTACGDAPTTPEPLVTDGLALRAVPSTSTRAFTQTFLRFYPCTGEGEIVEFIGTLHLTIHRTLFDTRSTIVVITAIVNSSGTGQTTGDTYRGVKHTLETGNIFPTHEADLILRDQTIIISPGGSPNALLKFFLFVRLNANGEVTVDFDFGSISCV